MLHFKLHVYFLNNWYVLIWLLCIRNCRACIKKDALCKIEIFDWWFFKIIPVFLSVRVPTTTTRHCRCTWFSNLHHDNVLSCTGAATLELIPMASNWSRRSRSPLMMSRYRDCSRCCQYSRINGMQHRPTMKVAIATITMLLTTTLEWAVLSHATPVHGDSQKQW